MQVDRGGERGRPISVFDVGQEYWMDRSNALGWAGVATMRTLGKMRRTGRGFDVGHIFEGDLWVMGGIMHNGF